MEGVCSVQDSSNKKSLQNSKSSQGEAWGLVGFSKVFSGTWLVLLFQRMKVCQGKRTEISQWCQEHEKGLGVTSIAFEDTYFWVYPEIYPIFLHAYQVLVDYFIVLLTPTNVSSTRRGMRGVLYTAISKFWAFIQSPEHVNTEYIYAEWINECMNRVALCVKWAHFQCLVKCLPHTNV